MHTEIRTDLALEEKERFAGTDVEIPGVELEKHRSEGGIYEITTVRIVNDEGAERMHKDIGNYVTLENCRVDMYDDCLQEELSEEIAGQLKVLIENFREKKQLKSEKILVVGLGNRDATPDALGPAVIERMITGEMVYGVAPGVKGQTGMETAEYVRGIAKESNTGMIIAIDSLAARNTKRLNTTIQITDTGIHPGSGVGNHRQAINEEAMGIPVIAIGVPTVVDAATIVNDVLENLLVVLANTPSMHSMIKTLEGFSDAEKRQMVKELMSEEARELYVTPKDIDEHIFILGNVIASGINQALVYE